MRMCVWSRVRTRARGRFRQATPVVALIGEPPVEAGQKESRRASRGCRAHIHARHGGGRGGDDDLRRRRDPTTIRGPVLQGCVRRHRRWARPARLRYSCLPTSIEGPPMVRWGGMPDGCLCTCPYTRPYACLYAWLFACPRSCTRSGDDFRSDNAENSESTKLCTSISALPLSASPTACPLRGHGRAGTENDGLARAVVSSTGTSMPAQQTRRRRRRDGAEIGCLDTGDDFRSDNDENCESMDFSPVRITELLGCASMAFPSWP